MDYGLGSVIGVYDYTEIGLYNTSPPPKQANVPWLKHLLLLNA